MILCSHLVRSWLSSLVVVIKHYISWLPDYIIIFAGTGPRAKYFFLELLNAGRLLNELGPINIDTSSFINHRNFETGKCSSCKRFSSGEVMDNELLGGRLTGHVIYK